MNQAGAQSCLKDFAGKKGSKRCFAGIVAKSWQVVPRFALLVGLIL